ncbi:MAG: hypothetical protein O2816_08375 [Planctomycetota bacterium]|nr:hypothetical protein [Planctomycetota bacterium]
MGERQELEGGTGTTGRGVGARMLRVLRFVLLVTGYASWLVLGAGVALDNSTWPERWIEEALSAELGPAVGAVEIDDVELDWTRRTVILSGVTLGDPDKSAKDLTLARLTARVGWSRTTGLRLERAEAAGGDLRISRALITGLEGLMESRPEREPKGLPELVVRDLSIAVETPEYGDVAVGRLDAALLSDPQHGARVTGRLIPALGRGTGAVFLTGNLTDDDVLEVRGAARAVPLAAEDLPDDRAFDLWRSLEISGVFDMEARATWKLGEDVLPTATARLALDHGGLTLPWLENASERRVRDLEAAFEVSFDPGEPLALWDRTAWRATGRAGARWEEIDLSCVGRLGQAATHGRLAEAWIHVPHLPLEGSTLDLAAGAHWMSDLWGALEPSGEVAMSYGIAFPNGWTPQDGIVDATERVLAVKPGGRADAAYAGWPAPGSSVRDQGFPLRLSQVEGRVHYVHRPGRQLAEEISLHGLRARHGDDLIDATCSLRQTPGWTRPPELRRSGPERFHLRAVSEGLTVGDHLAEAFRGLRGLEGCETLWMDYLPQGGRLGVRIEMLRNPEHPGMASEVEVLFHDVEARWADFAVPCDQVNGRLLLRSDGRGLEQGRAVTTLDLTGRTKQAGEAVRVLGRNEGGADGPGEATWAVRIDEMDLVGSQLREQLGIRDPETLARIEAAGLIGKGDVLVRANREASGYDQPISLEIGTTPGGVSFQPDIFPMLTDAASGRVLASWRAGPGAGPEFELRFGLLGSWAGAGAPLPVWYGGHFPLEGPTRIEVIGAGADPLDPRLLASLETALADQSEDPIDLEFKGVSSRGSIDFAASLEMAPGTTEVVGGGVVVQARLHELLFDGVSLFGDLQGPLSWNAVDNVWNGRLLTARLGRTAVALREVTFERLGRDGWRLDGRLAAEAVPIDREHLEVFLDARAVRTLLEEFDTTGRFDIKDGALSVIHRGGRSDVKFEGSLRIEDMRTVVGLPVEVRFAEDVELDLRIEAGRVRALARVGLLSGKVADRQLDDARLQLTYVEPRLTIEALDGAFEGGRLRSLAGRGGSTFFAIDLEPPFPFVFAGRMAQVEAGKLLRGIFNSSFANKGLVDATLQLRGDLDHLTGIEGAGEYELSESALWAVPVFQAVLSRLGFPTAATFSRMQGDYQIADGVITFPEMRLESDMMFLVGGGTIDFDGTLAHDFEVRYALLDQFGLLTRLLYVIQNSLLSLSVRGDMSRPAVVVRGLFSGFFGKPSVRQRLPLPSYGELPKRF